MKCDQCRHCGAWVTRLYWLEGKSWVCLKCKKILETLNVKQVKL